ncbi:MAG TPA: hypothetical protein VF054_01430 [Micromonosporaceae bacterium]
MLLKNIGQNRNDVREQRLAGSRVDELPLAEAPPCVSERATFMSPRTIPYERTHPFVSKNRAFASFEPTPQPMPPSSARRVAAN